VIAGTPQSVADRILALRNEVGAFGTLLYTGHDWTDPALARRSMELMANEVLPRIDQVARQDSERAN
jgi:alkanesulfonate monooxygenase SsuD/methylene tetrahydromethanopterin reductase-like flavin-dependent oxidoreductase (luciferase family)